MTTNRQYRILIVDDEPFNLDTLVGLLKDDHRTVIARDGEQALRRIAGGEPPDLILLDILMPGMDGYEVCRRLKSDSATVDIPVIFVTALSGDTDETQGFELGAVDYITKPFSAPVVRARVRTHLALRDSLDSLRTLNTHLQDLDRLKTQFLGMAAHDLRNPLNVIRGMSHMLRHMAVPEEAQRRLLDSVYTASDRMLALVENLLDASVIENGGFELRRNPDDLPRLAQERLELMAFLAQAKGIRIETRIAPIPTFPFDANHMSQVLDNLLGNAIKFSPPASVVHFACGADDRTAWLTVADQGPGIPPLERQNLFGAFRRLSSRPTAGEKSTGLGLAIVRSIVDAHCGSIEVESAIGQGSTFTVRLPLVAKA